LFFCTGFDLVEFSFQSCRARFLVSVSDPSRSKKGISTAKGSSSDHEGFSVFNVQFGRLLLPIGSHGQRLGTLVPPLTSAVYKNGASVSEPLFWGGVPGFDGRRPSKGGSLLAVMAVSRPERPLVGRSLASPLYRLGR